MNKTILLVKTRISREIVLSSSIVNLATKKSPKVNYRFETSIHSESTDAINRVSAIPPRRLIWGCSSCIYKSVFLFRFTKWMHNRIAIHLFECAKKPPEFHPPKKPRKKKEKVIGDR